MKICNRCVLPETFPGIRFTSQGLCQYCANDNNSSAYDETKAQYRRRLRELLLQVRSNGAYDAIVAYSGGKDSSYTLQLLAEDLNIRVLAVTFNHGFLSARAIENIRSVTEALNIAHLMLSPSPEALKEAFRKSITSNIYSIKELQRASAICNTCMGLAKSLILRTAIEMGIPLIAYGWSPGQIPLRSSIMSLNEQMMRQANSNLIHKLDSIMGGDLTPFLLQERHFRLFSLEATHPGYHYLHPLAFYNYDESAMVQKIKTLGWINPSDTDSNSTNCLLNSFANQLHQETYGFHPYSLEIANLVRMGCTSRADGLAKLAKPADGRVVDHIKTKLGLVEGEFSSKP